MLQLGPFGVLVKRSSIPLDDGNAILNNDRVLLCPATDAAVKILCERLRLDVVAIDMTAGRLDPGPCRWLNHSVKRHNGDAAVFENGGNPKFRR